MLTNCVMPTRRALRGIDGRLSDWVVFHCARSSDHVTLAKADFAGRCLDGEARGDGTDFGSLRYAHAHHGRGDGGFGREKALT